MKFRAISIALVLVVVAAGCGSKKSATKTVASGTTTTVTTQASSSGGSGSGGSSSGSTPSFASAKNCAQLASIGEKFSKAMAASSGSGTSSVTNTAEVFKALADAAPSEIRADFETIAAAFSSYADALKKSGYTPGKVPTASQLAALSSLSKTFSSAKLTAAEQHLSAWGKKNCGG